MALHDLKGSEGGKVDNGLDGKRSRQGMGPVSSRGPAMRQGTRMGAQG